MGTIPPVLHRSAQAIGAREFLDAVQATCPPRFPFARGSQHRHVAIAVSGGADSMALAFLCSQTKRWDPFFKVSDNPLRKFLVFVVDHKLREGSTEEALRVKRVVTEKLGLRADTLRLDWEPHLGPGVNPNDQSNVESLARRLRYRRLASALRFSSIVSLFVAHHQDDQYETVLMRLLSGHGVRGLRGMRAATDIPECSDMHQVYQSGFIDDQMNDNPWYNMKPSVSQKRFLRRRMRDEIDPALLEEEARKGLGLDMDLGSLYEEPARANKAAKWASKWAPQLEPLDIEDGGITVYRPLLPFSKDRLIATCLHNKIPWFEDHTNQDRTLTLRNAVRHLYKNHEMPAALQKPAILRLSGRCNERAAAEDAEAERLFSRAVVHDFDVNVGTMIVELPHIELPSAPASYRRSRLRRKRRLAHYRVIAALLFRKLLGLVSPEPNLTPLASLQSMVARLFPSLQEGGRHDVDRASQPKGFVVCGAHFVPLVGDHPLRWYLSRAPYPSQIPLPVARFSEVSISNRYRGSPSQWRYTAWLPWKLFDGRFWVRLRHKLPFPVQVRPFEAKYSKPFRESLADDEERETLAATLRKYAPGKVRYTLPAIYCEGDAEALMHGVGCHAASWHGSSGDDPVPAHAESSNTAGRRKLIPYWEQRAQEVEELRFMESQRDEGGGEDSELQLLALPTLGVHVAGLETWLQWEVRYRRADLGFLAKAMTDEDQRHRRRRPQAAARRRKPKRTRGDPRTYRRVRDKH